MILRRLDYTGRKASQAFTLIELMLVVIIIGILASIIVPKFAGRSEDAKIAAAKASLKSIALALDMYELDNQRYPKDLSELSAKYMKKFENKDPWGSAYEYKPSSDCKEYTLKSLGSDKTSGGSDDIGE